MTLQAKRAAFWFLCTTLTLSSFVTYTPDAGADAAGPTDYRTEIVRIEPEGAPIDVEMIGGDSFIRLEVLEPVEVVVIGYQGEDYLRFDADGTVVENRRSPSTWVNQERFGTEEIPAFADPQAPPDWVRVGSQASYAWHDHRTHWMSEVRPAGSAPGDQVLEATVPLLIDEQPVTVHVASYLLDPPSILPSVAGSLLGLLLAVLGWTRGRSWLLVIGGAAATAALALGVVAFVSVPSETEPQRVLWLVPMIGLVAAIVALGVRARLATTVYLDGLAVVVGAMLIAWSAIRVDALQRALIPSNAPAWLDRTAIVVALVVGVPLVLRGMWGLFRPERLDGRP